MRFTPRSVVLTATAVLVAVLSAVCCAGNEQEEITQLKVNQAEIIARGRVESTESLLIDYDGAHQTYTLVSFASQSIVKGPPLQHLVFRVRGGTRDGITTTVAGRPNLAEGDTCLVFLEGDSGDELFCREKPLLVTGGSVSPYGERQAASTYESRLRSIADEQSFPALARKAPLIVEGDVRTVLDNRFDAERTQPAYAIEIVNAFAHKGTAADSIWVMPLPTLAAWYGVPEFQVGEHVVVALSIDTTGEYRLAGGCESMAVRGSGRRGFRISCPRLVRALPASVSLRADRLERMRLEEQVVSSVLEAVAE